MRMCCCSACGLCKPTSVTIPFSRTYFGSPPPLGYCCLGPGLCCFQFCGAVALFATDIFLSSAVEGSVTPHTVARMMEIFATRQKPRPDFRLSEALTEDLVRSYEDVILAQHELLEGRDAYIESLREDQKMVQTMLRSAIELANAVADEELVRQEDLEDAPTTPAVKYKKLDFRCG